MLGLLVETDEAWVEHALADVDALLIDHAHCEMKAASNALSLVVRHGDRPELVTALISIAQEELEHFRLVHERMRARGLTLGVPPVDPYAKLLRNAVNVDVNNTAKARKKGTRSSGGASEVAEVLPATGALAAALIDRLLIAALIEARSCERFRILSLRCPTEDLRVFYHELLASEAGHYRTFVDLAVAEANRPESSVGPSAITDFPGSPEDFVRARLVALSRQEADVVRQVAASHVAVQPNLPLVPSRASIHG